MIIKFVLASTKAEAMKIERKKKDPKEVEGIKMIEFGPILFVCG